MTTVTKMPECKIANCRKEGCTKRRCQLINHETGQIWEAYLTECEIKEIMDRYSNSLADSFSKKTQPLQEHESEQGESGLRTLKENIPLQGNE